MKRARLRAWRRGIREADLILGPFADSHASDLTPDELAAFEALLDQPDPEVYAWITGQTPTPSAFDGPVMRRLKAFHGTDR